MTMTSIWTQCQKNPDIYYAQAFRRNIGLLSEAQQQALRRTTIAIAGVGGVGGFHLMTLLRMGVGRFHIADMDQYDVPNLQRQCGAFMHTLGQNKTEAMKKMALAVNPHAEITTFPDGVNADNLKAFLSGVDIVIDGLEFFAVDIRRDLFNAARKKGVHTITAGPLAFGSALLIFSPKGMGFDEYFDITATSPEMDKIIAFAVGLAPAALHMPYIDLKTVDPRQRTGPALVSSCQLCASVAAVEVLKILFHPQKVRSVPHYSQWDLFGQRYRKGYLWKGNRHPWQRLKRWYLEKHFK